MRCQTNVILHIKIELKIPAFPVRESDYCEVPAQPDIDHSTPALLRASLRFDRCLSQNFVIGS